MNYNNYIKFLGYSSSPEIYYKNSSLHLFTSISESFGLVLCETKLYGIPTILLGLDYISMAKGGTIIIYDDKPETISKEAIKILKYYKYRKKLGKEARKSMKPFSNDLLSKKWIKLILSIFNDGIYYLKLKEEKKISKNKYLNILNNQLKLLKIRKADFINISINNFENFSFLKEIKI